MKESYLGNILPNLKVDELERQIKKGNAAQVISTIETTLNKVDNSSKNRIIQLLLFKAEANLWLGNFDKCLEDLKEVELFLKQDFDRKLNHKIMILFAECYSYMGYYENSNEYIELGLKQTNFIGDESTKIQFMILKAKYHKYSHRDNLYYDTIEDAFNLWFDSNLKPIPLLSYYYGKVSIEIDLESDAKGELTAAFNLYKELSDVRGMVNILIQYDKLNEENENNEKSTYLEEALNIALAVNDSLGLGEIYHHVGWKFLNKKDPQKARKYFEKAENIYVKLDARYLMARAIQDSAFVFHNESDYSKAIQLFDTAIQIYLETNTFFDASDGLYNKGHSLFAKKDYAEAFLSFNHSAYYYTKNKRGMKSDIAMRSYWCARSKSKLGLYDEALGFYNTAIFVFKEKEMSDMLSDTYYRIAEDFRTQGNQEKVIEYQKLATASSRENSNKIILRMKLREEVEQLILNKDYTKAHNVNQELLVLVKDIEDKEFLAVTYWFEGNIYSGLDEKYKALEYYNLAYNIFDEINNNYSTMACLTQIGKLYAELKDYKKALTYYKKAEEIIERKEYPDNYAELCDSLANCYYSLEEYELSIDYYYNVIDYWKKAKNKEEKKRLKNLARTYEDIGIAYIKLNNFTNAIENLKNSVIYYEKINMHEDAALKNIQLGIILSNKKEWCNDAITYLDKARSYYVNYGSNNTEILADIYELLGMLYCDNGEMDRGKLILGMAIINYQKLKNKEKEKRIRNYLKSL